MADIAIPIKFFPFFDLGFVPVFLYVQYLIGV